MRTTVMVVLTVMFLGLLAIIMLTGPNSVPGEHFDWEVLTFVTDGYYGEYAWCVRCNKNVVVEIPMGLLPSDVTLKCDRCGLEVGVIESEDKP